MSTLDLDVLLFVVVALLVVAAWLAAYRPKPRDAGIVGGLAMGALALALAVDGTGALLRADGVSIPRIAVVALATVGLFAVLPRRHATWTRSGALWVLLAADVAVVASPSGVPVALAWAMEGLATLFVLPAGPLRRLALPYVGLSTVAGVGGLAIGGPAGLGLMLLAVALRLGVFPFHSWIVAAWERAPSVVAVALSAPMSAIALVSRSPLGIDDRAGTLLVAALAVSAGLTAGLAIIQERLGRAVGLFTASVSAIVLLGLLDSDPIGHLGGLLMWNLSGLSLLGLGLVVAALESRVGALAIDVHGGLVARAPFFATVFLLFGMAAVGTPGTAAFASEDLVLHGAMAHHPVLLLLFAGAVSVQAYAVLHLFFRVFLGPPRIRLADALPRERFALGVLAGLLLAAGLAPQLFVGAWTPEVVAVVDTP